MLIIFVILALIVGVCIGTLFPQPPLVAALEKKFPAFFAWLNSVFGKKTEPTPAPVPVSTSSSAPTSTTTIEASKPE